MNETEQKIAKKLAQQIADAPSSKQLQEIRKYSDFLGAVSIRVHIEKNTVTK